MTDIGLLLDMIGVMLIGVVAQGARFRQSSFSGHQGSIIEHLTPAGRRIARVGWLFIILGFLFQTSWL